MTLGHILFCIMLKFCLLSSYECVCVRVSGCGCPAVSVSCCGSSAVIRSWCRQRLIGLLGLLPPERLKWGGYKYQLLRPAHSLQIQPPSLKQPATSWLCTLCLVIDFESDFVRGGQPNLWRALCLSFSLWNPSLEFVYTITILCYWELYVIFFVCSVKIKLVVNFWGVSGWLHWEWLSPEQYHVVFMVPLD